LRYGDQMRIKPTTESQEDPMDLLSSVKPEIESEETDAESFKEHFPKTSKIESVFAAPNDSRKERGRNSRGGGSKVRVEVRRTR